MTELQQVIGNMAKVVARIENALKGDVQGYVHVWPKHWLAVKVNNDVCHAVHVVDATAVSKRDQRVFRNGADERAVLMLREKALCGALVHAVSILETFQAMDKEIA